MDTSLAELRSPLEGRPLDERAARRAPPSSRPTAGPASSVHGRAPELPPLVAAHVYRIGSEALTNALRHADATTIDVELAPRRGGTSACASPTTAAACPSSAARGATGLLAMQNRAATHRRAPHRSAAPDGSGTRRPLDDPPHPERLSMIRIARRRRPPRAARRLQTVLEAEPGIVYAGESSGARRSLWPMLGATEPDLVLLDYHLPHGDGLQLCYRIKQQVAGAEGAHLLGLREPGAGAARARWPAPTGC